MLNKQPHELPNEPLNINRTRGKNSDKLKVTSFKLATIFV